MEKQNAILEKLEPVFEKVEALPRPQRIALFVGIFVLVVGSFVYFFYFPKIAEIKKLSDQHEKLINKLDAAKKNAAKLESFEKKMQKAEAEFKLAVKALPNSQEIPTLLSSISQSGKSSGLQFKLFQPKGARKKGFYAEIPVSMAIVGNYHNIAVFFQKVAELDRIVNIKNINMKQAKGSGLNVSCQAVTYQFIKATKKKKKRRKKKR